MKTINNSHVDVASEEISRIHGSFEMEQFVRAVRNTRNQSFQMALTDDSNPGIN